MPLGCPFRKEQACDMVLAGGAQEAPGGAGCPVQSSGRLFTWTGMTPTKSSPTPNSSS